MKQIKITLPESKDELTLSTYLKLIEIEQNDSLGDKERVLKTMQAVFDLTLDQAKQIQFSDVININEHFVNLVGKEEKRKVIPTFDYEGVQYGMIPNLDEITLAEYIDLEESEKDPLQANVFLNVMYREIKSSAGGKYTIIPYDDSKTVDFGNLPVSVLDRAKVFFCNLSSQLLSSIEMKSMNLIQMSQQKSETITLDGDGITHFTKLQRAISQNMTAYYQKIYMRFFNLSNMRGALIALREKE